MLLLAGQILYSTVVPPTPVRLPQESPIKEKILESSPAPIFQKSPKVPTTKIKAVDKEPTNNFNYDWLPSIKGKTPYTSDQLKIILRYCKREQLSETLRSCAATLTANLINDGYVNSRVFTLVEGENGVLEVVQGQIAEIRIESDDADLAKEVRQELKVLTGGVLHLPTLEKALFAVRSVPGVGQITGNIGRLGSDATKAVLNLTVDQAPSPWQGELSFTNDGNAGTGAYKTSSTFVKQSFAKRNDNFIGSIELNNDSEAELGAFVTSATYTWPISKKWRFTNSFSYSERNYVEYTDSLRDISFETTQILSQLEKTIHTSSNQEWTSFAAININTTDSYLAGERADLVSGAGSEGWVRTGHLKAGVNFAGARNSLSWTGNIYGMQGLSGFSKGSQRTDLAEDGIYPGEARAVGTMTNLAWTIKPGLGLNVGAGGQIAFNPLISSMSFGIGSGAGIRGLPSSLTSGDSGWIGTTELVVTAWQKGDRAFQIVPFIGIGGTHSDVLGTVTDDTAGAGGILARFVKPKWVMEIGFVDSFETDDNSGVWNDWLLGDGVFSSVKIRL